MGIDRLFYPRKVAVVGSMSTGKLGYELANQILAGGFKNLIAVNPKAQGLGQGYGLTEGHGLTHGAAAIPGFRTIAEGSRAEDGKPVDLAVIASPAETVLEVLEDCHAAGVGMAVIITSGFGEVGNHAAEDEVRRLAAAYRIRVVGPNCAGIASSGSNLYATLELQPPKGGMAFITQSGAVGGAVLSWAEEQGVGISKFVSYGNRVDLDEVDLLPYLADDEETRVAALYLECVRDGQAFIHAAHEFTRKKPLVVIKSGRSRCGQRAALSHTGSLSGADAVYDAAFKACGAIRVESLEEMFDLCKGFATLPPVRGHKLLIVTNSGGPGILAADRAEALGLDVGEPSTEGKARLREILSSNGALGNPIDLTVQGTEADFRETLGALLPEYDAAVAINVATPYLDSVALARGISDGAAGEGVAGVKPVAASFMAGRLVSQAVQAFRGWGIPTYSTGERAVGVFARMAADYEARQSWRPLASPPRPAGDLPVGEDGSFLEPQAMAWLGQNGIPVPPFRVAKSAQAAARCSAELGYPVVMKVVSPDILHKSEAGGVVVGVSNPVEAETAFCKLEQAARGKRFEGVVIYPLVRKAQEVLLGCTRDPQFGPVVAVGLGGIYTEVLRDIALRAAPIDEDDALGMLEELRSFAMLSGARGQPPVDIKALAGLVARVSCLPFLYPQIEELDLNPVFALPQGVLVGDVRVIRKEETGS
jgi:acetyltransferase